MPEESIALLKAHAYGNDFLLVRREAVAEVTDLSEFAVHVCDRHRGFGADGLLVVDDSLAEPRSRLWNADGSRSELSGNGVRCVGAWLALERGLEPGGSLTVQSEAGPKRLTLLERKGRSSRFRADMGPPTELREEILAVAGEQLRVVVLRVGNPQCVVLGPVSHERLHSVGAALAVHPSFPEGTNVELADVETPDRIRILIWERGVGPTEASGTGACAAAVAAAAFGGAARSVTVVAPGGEQQVEWTGEGLLLTGWAEVVGQVEWGAMSPNRR